MPTLPDGKGSHLAPTVTIVTTAAPLPVYTNAQVASYIRSGYYGVDYKWNLGASGTAPLAGVLTYSTAGLGAPRAAIAEQAIALYEAVLGIDFVQRTGGGADLVLDDSGTGASTSFSAIGSTITSARVNVQAGWNGGSNAMGDYVFQTFLHEIGHVLGLGHAGDYDGTGTYVDDTTDPGYGNNSNHYRNDSWQATVMSYFDQVENTYVSASRAYLISPMVADWIALGGKYGLDAFAGNTTWGFRTNIGSTVFADLADFADENAFTIVDSSGTDTVNFSGFGANQTIDLNPEAISDIGGLKGNMSVARGTLIENAVGGSGRDVIYGNAAANVIRGGPGNDTIHGGAGGDHLRGDLGRDVLLAGGGADTLQGSSGRDMLTGGGGADRFLFTKVEDSPGSAAACDVLRAGAGASAFQGAGAAGGDRIDLAAIDADVTAGGNQAFVFGETGKGGVWCSDSGNRTVVLANIDNDAAAEFRLDILDGGVSASAYGAVDFIL